MDAQDPLPRMNAQILEEAAHWLVEFNGGDVDAALQARFHQWLRTSPEHVRAYLELVPIWEAGSTMPLEGSVNVDALIALGRSPDNIVPLDPAAVDSPGPSYNSAPPANSRRVPGALRSRRLALAACAVLIAIGVSILSWVTYAQDPTYETGVGQQQSIGLAEGSTIELNARTRVRVHMTEHERGVELVEGQALFRVAKDPTRPFVVASGGTRIRAVGTEFDVYRRAVGTTVTVVEGRVAVLSGDSSSDRLLTGQVGRVSAPTSLDPGLETPLAKGHALLVDAGEQVTVTGQTAPKLKRADVVAATAWTQRRLVFDASTLADVVEEFNRYSTRRLVLRDASLASFPITGAFSSTDPSSLVRFLQMQPHIRVAVGEKEIEIATAP